MYTTKLSPCSGFWYVDIVDRFCGTIERGATVAIEVYAGSRGDTTKTVVFLHILDQVCLL